MSDAANDEQKLYILGHPVAHSKSPAMYNAVYGRLGLPWHYDFMDCATKEEAQRFLDARDFLSINITTPYKGLALKAATNSAASAKLAGGANILIRRGEALIGFNTDGQGAVAYLEREGFDFRDKKVVVCGTGPTALAILHAACIAGAGECVLLSRDKDKAARVLEGYVGRFDTLSHATVDLAAAKVGHRSFLQAFNDTAFKFGSYETSKQAISGADLVVNATPLGMGDADPAPFDVALFREGQSAFDVVYAHGETAFAAGARAAGARFYDGRGMLVAQAVATAQAVCEVSGVDVALPFDETFDEMARAAGFAL